MKRYFAADDETGGGETSIKVEVATAQAETVAAEAEASVAAAAAETATAAAQEATAMAHAQAARAELEAAETVAEVTEEIEEWRSELAETRSQISSLGAMVATLQTELSAQSEAIQKLIQPPLTETIVETPEEAAESLEVIEEKSAVPEVQNPAPRRVRWV